MEKYFFLEHHVTTEGAISHNILHYQQLVITCYQVRFYANNYFEKYTVVSTALKLSKQSFFFFLICWSESIGIKKMEYSKYFC